LRYFRIAGRIDWRRLIPNASAAPWCDRSSFAIALRYLSAASASALVLCCGLARMVRGEKRHCVQAGAHTSVPNFVNDFKGPVWTYGLARLTCPIVAGIDSPFFHAPDLQSAQCPALLVV